MHQGATVIAVLDNRGKLVMESILETQASGIVQFMHGLRGEFKRVSHDIEMRVAEVIEGASEKVWGQRDGFCYLLLAGRTIRVPPDAHVYGNLREANIVRVAFLPTAVVAVHVESDRGLGHIAVSAPVPDNLRSKRVSLDGP